MTSRGGLARGRTQQRLGVHLKKFGDDASNPAAQKRISRVAVGRHGFLIFGNSLFQIEKHALMTQRLAKYRTLNYGQDVWLQPNKPQQNPAVATSLLGLGQHFERCVFEIVDAAEIERDYFGPCLRNQGPHLVRYEFGVREENKPFQSQQQQARKGFIIRVLLLLRPEHISSRFAPENINWWI